MKIFVRDRNKDLIDELVKLGGECIVAEHADILSSPVDCFFSPANSFGFMDGGVDLVYSQKIGWHLPERLQKKIKEECKFGELLVGQALHIETDNAQFPNMISAPTMRLPGRITDTNIFLAMRAAVDLAVELGFKTVATPGFGTGVGGVNPSAAAYAMRCGILSTLKAHDIIVDA